MADLNKWLETSEGSHYDPNPKVDWLEDFAQGLGDANDGNDADWSGELEQQPDSVDSEITPNPARREGHLICDLADALKEWEALESQSGAGISTSRPTRQSTYNSMMACYISTTRSDHSPSDMIFSKPLFKAVLESLEGLPGELRSEFYTDPDTLKEWLDRVKSCTTSFRELSKHIEMRCRNDFGELGEPVMAWLDQELSVTQVDDAIAAYAKALPGDTYAEEGQDNDSGDAFCG